MINIIAVYVIFSCLGCALAFALNEIDTDKAVVKFFIGLSIGWIYIPIKFVRGLKKYTKEDKWHY